MDDLVPADGTPTPVPSASSEDRAAVVDLLQWAVSSRLIGADELDRRLALVATSTRRDQLDELLADLPEPYRVRRLPAERTLAPARSSSILGDVKIGGWVDIGTGVHASAILGNVVVDLTTVEIRDGVEISARTVMGDVRIIVPDGINVRIDHVSCMLGDRKINLVPAVAGRPTIHLDLQTVLGDVKVYSLSEAPRKLLRRLWSRRQR